MSPERQRQLQEAIAAAARSKGIYSGRLDVLLVHENDCKSELNPSRGLDLCECKELAIVLTGPPPPGTELHQRAEIRIGQADGVWEPVH